MATDTKGAFAVVSAARSWRALAAACLFLALLLVLAWPAPVRATTLEWMSIEQLSQRAAIIVEGAVVSTAVEQTPAGVRTAVRIKVKDSLKGAPSTFKTAYVPGGTLPDGTQVIVDSMASFHVGESCYVFIDDLGWVMGGFQGKLDVAGGRVLGSGVSTETMSRRIAAALRGAKPAARPAARAPLHPATSPQAGAPTISSISPGAGSAGTDTHVTIFGSGFGSSTGKVEFSYGRNSVMWIGADDISSWTDTSINCAVPRYNLDAYNASAGSGPVVVTTSTGAASNRYLFSVPFGYLGAKWASPAVTYFLNTSGIDKALRETLVDAGTAEWNGAGSAFRFTDGGVLPDAGYAPDRLNVISWGWGLPGGVLAQATTYVIGGIVSECDVQFNNAYPWGDGAPGTNTVDIQGTAAHETGHWLRLADQFMPGDSAKVMYCGSEKNQQTKRVLAAGDIAGINWIYPVSINVTAPTGSSSYPVGGNLTVSWTTSSATAGGMFGVWARSPGGGWYIGKMVYASGGTSYSTDVTLDVPAGGGYEAIVAWRSAVIGGAWTSWGTSPGSFAVTGDLTVTAPTGSASYPVGGNLTVSWTMRSAAASGEFGVWARSPGGSWYALKLVPASGGTSYSTDVILDVPAGGGYEAIVAWRGTAGGVGGWTSWGTSPGSFAVTGTGLAIGQPYGGGVVAYVDGSGQHGLIAAAADQTGAGAYDGIQWATEPFWYTSVPGALGVAIGTGTANTNAIIAQNGPGATYAAGLARAYTGGGYTDWFLPSRDELNKLYLNRVAIGGFHTIWKDTPWYWSSSQDADYASGAWSQYFDDGYQSNGYGKYDTARVRAVRAF